jgi:TolB-like protein/DNA-binding winged helix-turn-helix (wHTH) protein/Tfp pilus assembly protein PilF
LYQFEGFELDLKRYELRRNSHVLKLEKIPMELLILLVSKNGELVSRDEIVEKLWGQNVFVETDHGVNTAVRKIRQTLGDDPENSRFVQTVVGKGYRFAARVSRKTEGSVAPQGSEQKLEAPPQNVLKKSGLRVWHWVAVPILVIAAISFGLNALGIRDRLLGRVRPARIGSLAVLPLENLSGDASQEFFADGMTDELITDLAQIRDLRVISRTSVMRFKGTRKPLPQIARELSVDAVVEGTVERAGGRVRVRAQLIRASDDRHLWAESFERNLADVLSLQSEVASGIARQVQVNLLEARPGGNRPIDPTAYEAYLKGRFVWNKRSEGGLQQSIDFFQQAIAIDPNYAEAYSGLADSYTTLGYLGYFSPRDSFPQARAAAEKAIALDPSLAEPHTSLAYVHLYFDWDWAAAENEFKKAISLNPNYATAHEWYSIYLIAMQRPNEAKAEINRALELDPLSLVINTDVGYQLFYARKYDEAIVQFRKTLQMAPKFGLAHLWLGRAYQQKGMYSEAMEEYRATDAATPNWVVTLAGIGNLEGVASHNDKAREMLSKLAVMSKEKYVTPYGIALIYAGMGDKDQAFHFLNKAVDDRAHWLVWLRFDPRWDSMRADLRYADLERRIGLPINVRN